MIDDAGVTRSVDGGFDVLWEREGAVVSFVLVAAPGPGGLDMVWTLPEVDQ